MKSTLQATSASDLGALSQFLARAFDAAPGAPFVNPAVMTWKYWDARGDWSGPRSYVLMRDGAITAHAGIWPMTFGSGADAVRGVHMIDWASAKEAPGAGLALVQKLAGMYDFIYSIGGSEMTCKVLPSFGFVEYARVWKGVRPLRPVRQMLTHQSRNWKLAPRLLRNSLWAAQGARSKKNWQAKEVLAAELSGNDLASDFIPRTNHASPRPAAFFEYLLRSPAAPFRFYKISEGGQRMGHFALSLVRGQARIAGVWLREASVEAWAAAYRLARNTARDLPGACEVVAVGSVGASGAGAEQAGFRILPGPTVYLLDKTKDKTKTDKTKRLPLGEDFQFQLCDSDAAFLDSGAASYWS
jgi:hypothetical protein